MTSREAGWREVLTLAALIVVAVLTLQLVSTFVPAVGQLVSGPPTVIFVLATATIALVVLAARAQRRR